MLRVSLARGRRFPAPILAALLTGLGAALAALPAHATGTARLAFDSAGGAGWSARGIVVELALHAPRATLTLREARLPGALGVARRLRIDCPRLTTRDGVYGCASASVTGEFGVLGRQRLVLDVEWHSGTGDLRFDARELALAAGRVRTAGAFEAGRWRIEATGEALELAAAAQLAAPWVALPDGASAAGRVAFDAVASGRGAAVREAHAKLELASIAVANAAGTVATDALAGHVDVQLADEHGAWRFAARVRLPAGQAYVDPVFVDFGQLPLEAQARGVLAAGRRIEVEAFEAVQAGAIALEGRAELAPFPAAAPGERDRDDAAVDSAAPLIRRAELRIREATFPAAGMYVAPFLADTPLRNGTARGRLHGTVALVDDLPSRLDVTIDGLDLDDPGGALAFTRLHGRLRWYDEAARTAVARDGSAPDDAFVSTLAWDAGRAYGIALGAANLRFTTSGRGFRLLEPTVVPVLDGGLEIDTLRLRHAGTPEMWLRLDARVRPISVVLITRALGWPEFGGTIAGTIPQAALQDGVLTFGGNLEADVFGGRVVASGLRLEDPLGRFPRLYATLGAENLDLQQITGTFEFGEITGRLSGRVDDLELFGWEPVRFDARFATPPGDRSRRRISQRAVQNLSSIGGGGGIGAALQSGVLRFFETFRYDRLGLACRLENDVCRMSGVAPAPNGGYYIVRGSGLPRIDIIGSGDRVAWTRLVEQLRTATESGGVQVR